MLEVNCAAGHVMPLVPWSAGTHNPVVRAQRKHSHSLDHRHLGLTKAQTVAAALRWLLRHCIDGLAAFSQGYSGGWLCDDCGRSCTDLGSDSSFATSRFFCASCKSDYCRDCGSKKAAEAAKSRNATERPINHLPKVCPAGHKCAAFYASTPHPLHTTCVLRGIALL